jgi:hypothetical protein
VTYPTQWEYVPMFFRGDVTAGLNKQGADGWEVCYLIEERDGNDGRPAGTGIMMKRPKRLIETDLSAAPKVLSRA